MNHMKKTILVLCLVLFATSLATAQAVVERNRYEVQVTSLEENVFTTKYGNLNTTGNAQEFTASGFEWGDIVNVSFLGQSLDLPVIPTYSYVDTGSPAIILPKGDDGNPTGAISLAINMGDFTTTYGIATKTTNADKTWFWTANEGVQLPVRFVFTMAEKEGYMAQFMLHDLVRTNNREDYAQLDDNQFANFRKVTTTGMNGKLFRSSNPVNAEIGRNIQADNACRVAGVTVALNLADNMALAHSRPEFEGSYYSGINVKYLGLGVDFSSDDFKKGLAEGLRFMIENPGTYVVHCTEGKDRAGFVSALLECLMGASAHEVVEDYMVTYYNYYGVEKGTERYNAIASSNIVKTLTGAFGVQDFYSANLTKGAESYLSSIGLSSSEIAGLKANL